MKKALLGLNEGRNQNKSKQGALKSERSVTNFVKSRVQQGRSELTLKNSKVSFDVPRSAGSFSGNEIDRQTRISF